MSLFKLRTSNNIRFHQGAPKERRRGGAEKRLSKRVFLESPFLLCSLNVFSYLSGVLRENLKGAEKKRTLQKHPFGQLFLRTTPFAAPLVRPDFKKVSKFLDVVRSGQTKIGGAKKRRREVGRIEMS